MAVAAGVSAPKVFIATDFIAACLPDVGAGLLGDKATSVVMDNTMIKRFVPDFLATTRFRDGIEKTLRWFDGDASRRVVDAEANHRYDRLLAAYERVLQLARREFSYISVRQMPQSRYLHAAEPWTAVAYVPDISSKCCEVTLSSAPSSLNPDSFDPLPFASAPEEPAEAPSPLG